MVAREGTYGCARRHLWLREWMPIHTRCDTMTRMPDALADLLRIPAGPIDPSSFDTSATPGFVNGKSQGKKALEALGPVISDLQERLFAQARVDGRQSVLLVLQGMDTSGKGGTVRHCVGLLDPQGVSIASFKAPTPEEREHDFLWRISKRVPAAGMVGIFDRSHYEDVLIARVRELAPVDEIERRYAAINDFERLLVEADTTVIKCFLHISKDEQRERLVSRLEDPTKHWKYNPGDVDERLKWDAYQRAYAVALERCTTDHAPWYLIPADRKWYRNWAITSLLTEHLQRLDPQWPKPDYDIEEEKARVAAS
jgi:PPK2 family polyphosphate:nucleotide phosphotransferase